jgi:hypothetical protein
MWGLMFAAGIRTAPRPADRSLAPTKAAFMLKGRSGDEAPVLFSKRIPMKFDPKVWTRQFRSNGSRVYPDITK